MKTMKLSAPQKIALRMLGFRVVNGEIQNVDGSALTVECMKTIQAVIDGAS